MSHKLAYCDLIGLLQSNTTMDTAAAVGPPWFSCWLRTEGSRPETRNNELSDQFAEGEHGLCGCNACQLRAGDPSSCRCLEWAISQKEYRCHHLITHLPASVRPDVRSSPNLLSLSPFFSTLLLLSPETTSAAFSHLLLSGGWQQLIQRVLNAELASTQQNSW